MSVDWSKPIEALHEDGRVESVRLSINNQPLPSGFYYIGWPLHWHESERSFLPNGEPAKRNSGWHVRNVAESSALATYDPATHVAVKRMTEAEARAAYTRATQSRHRDTDSAVAMLVNLGVIKVLTPTEAFATKHGLALAEVEAFVADLKGEG